ncbi:MAG: hypothetical protein HOE90_06355 [Bacteriovoracaceae bacterium]|jgi:hypothetical protein|nr:hypothetical protein [Bacteriovoracaceae bacterium]
MKIEIQSSETKDIKVVILSKNFETVDFLEAKSEQDNQLQRMSIYSAKDVKEASELTRKYQCNLVIFEDEVDDKDYVYIQMEMINANENVQLIPITTSTDFLKRKESNSAGHVFDFLTASPFDDYEDFKTLLLKFAREYSQSHNSETLFEYAKTVGQTVHSIAGDNNQDNKDAQAILNKLLNYYDFSTKEKVDIIAANLIYSPNIDVNKYNEFISPNHHDLLNVLSATSSKASQNNSPSTSAGFIITLSHFISHSYQESGKDETIQNILKRPKQLKHKSIKALNETNLNEVISSIYEESGVVKYGS